VELIDPNVRNPVPLFSIDTASDRFDLHFLVIGVRELKSRLGVSKPQLVSTVPIAGDMVEVATDPSSDPSPKDANWLVTKKMTLDLPKNVELAPVVSLVIRDNKFGGLIKHYVGNAPLKISKFMQKTNEDGTDWVVKDVAKDVLDEKVLQAEIKAEEESEWRVYQAQQRVRELAIGKAKAVIEARCTLLPYDSEVKESLERLEKSEITILTWEQVQNIKLEEAKKKTSALSKVLGSAASRKTKPAAMETVPDESESESEAAEARSDAETTASDAGKAKKLQKSTSDTDVASSDEEREEKNTWTQMTH